MNGALPLLRTLEPGVRQSCSWSYSRSHSRGHSRIPHITAHILHRRTHVVAARSIHSHPHRHRHRHRQRDECLSSKAQRETLVKTGFVHHASTLALDNHDAVEHNEAEEVPTETETEPDFNGAALPFYRRAASDALHARTHHFPPMQDYIDQAHPDRLLHAFLHPNIGPPFIRQASDLDFAHAFQLLDPIHFLEDRKLIDRHIHPKLYCRYAIRKSSLLSGKFDFYLNCLKDIIGQRMAAGHLMTLDLYRQLLFWCEVVGNESLARDLFDSGMPQDAIIPDLPCYNHYLAACVWNGAYDVYYRSKIRNVHLNFLFRERVVFDNRATKEIRSLMRPRYERPPGQTIKSHALSVFANLTKQGLKPDEATFVNLILAFAYDSDVEGVKSVLKSVWNIDVDLLGRYDEEEIESPTFYDDGHPLRPSSRLLHAVVYAFVTNSDSFNASFLLDYISRNYNLSIPRHIWMVLFEFTAEFCGFFGPKRTARGLARGCLPHDALFKFFHIITDEPHNVKPDTWMLGRLSANAHSPLGDLQAALNTFRHALALRDEQLTIVSRLYDEMLVVCTDLKRELDPIPSLNFMDKRRTFIHESLKLDRDLEALRLVMYQILKNSWRFQISPWHSDEWSVRTLPALIREFEYFFPDKVTVRAPRFVYTIMNTKWHKERTISDTDGQFDVKSCRLRKILEEEDPILLHYKARQARKFIRYSEARCLVCMKEGDHLSDDCPRWEVGLAGYGLRYGEEEPIFDDYLALDRFTEGPHLKTPNPVVEQDPSEEHGPSKEQSLPETQEYLFW